MPVLPDWAIQALQVLSVLVLAPLITGLIARAEAIIQQRKGPRVLQPYYDILKLLDKETVLPAPAGPLFRLAPYVSFAVYATVPLLLPVLTSFGLPLGYMGDILAGGLILGMASFAISIAAIDSGRVAMTPAASVSRKSAAPAAVRAITEFQPSCST